MQILIKATAIVLLAAGFTASAFATPVTQTTAPVNYSSSGGWHNDLLSQVTFAQGTVKVSALTGSATIKDQGWGGEDPNSNQIYLSLVSNGTSLWGQHFAGGTHTWRTVNFDIANSAASFEALNNALINIDWALNPNVTMQLRSSTLGYSGWQLFVKDASFSVTSEVPEPASLALLGLGLAGLAASRRKVVKK